jgi:hypothetical protein
MKASLRILRRGENNTTKSIKNPYEVAIWQIVLSYSLLKLHEHNIALFADLKWTDKDLLPTLEREGQYRIMKIRINS